jgi:hypothetical protein
MTPRKNASKTRGKPFAPGNGGRPKGARNHVTLAVEALLEGEAESLTRTAIRLAQAGDTTALRLCLDRIAPPRRDRPIRAEVGALNSPKDALRAAASAIEAAGRGELTPAEAAAVVGLLEAYGRLFETAELEARLTALESQT